MNSLADLFSYMSVRKSASKVPQTIIYARVSSDTQSSIADQVEACRQYAKKLKLPPSEHVFTDVGSGMDVAKLKYHSTMTSRLASCLESHLVINDMSWQMYRNNATGRNDDERWHQNSLSSRQSCC